LRVRIDNVNGAKYRPTLMRLSKATRSLFEYELIVRHNYTKNHVKMWDEKTYNFMAAKTCPMYSPNTGHF